MKILFRFFLNVKSVFVRLKKKLTGSGFRKEVRHEITRKKIMFTKSDYLILGAAFISFLFSIALWFGILGPNQKDAGIFVGLWVPSILALGLYFKLNARTV